MKVYVNNIFRREKNKVAKDEEKKDILKYDCDNDSKNINNEISDKEKNENISNIYIRNGGKNILKNKKEYKLIDELNKLKKIITNLFFNKYKLPKSYYFLLFFMIGLATLSLKMVVDGEKTQMQEDYAVFNSYDNNNNNNNNDNNNEINIEQTSILNQDASSTNIDTRTEYENIISDIEKKVENTIKVKEVEELTFTKPMDGEISKIYSNDKLIYSKTLEMWKTHDGIDIKGDIGTPVFSIEKGYVEKIYNDAFYGITVVINHGQGYISTYSNLNEETKIKEGGNVKKGEKIGTIGTTSIGEIKDNPHLHFMLYKNNEIVDPSSIFN